MPSLQAMKPPATRRCAIYTRRSLEPVFGQEFNSLECQRAVCSAYITSQQHKGWIELATHYDDPGRSGANLNRPALQALLADIEDGLVDVVVIYKLDRLTRTLLDFVRLVDFLERYGVVFVSITQNFDTADSLGRLILNVLLTFAQFEREMASDRIRDKITVAKQQGRWTGGPAPIGYDNNRGKLKLNPTEAPIIRQIFERYVATGSYEAVFRELRDAGISSKRWKTRAKKIVGGGSITKASVYHILANPVYVGEARHREKTYPGLHQAIIDRELWNKVQAIRAKTKARYRRPENFLTGILFDAFGRPMCCLPREMPNGRSYRYYVSNSSEWAKRRRLRRIRANAAPLEELVLSAIDEFLADRPHIRAILIRLGVVRKDLDKLAASAPGFGRRLRQCRPGPLRAILAALILRIELSRERMKIVIRCEELRRLLAWDGVGVFGKDELAWQRNPLCEILDLPVSLVRCQNSYSLPIEPRAADHPAPNPGLVALLKEARRVQALVDDDRDSTLSELSAKMGRRPSEFSKVLKLNYLAPDIITSILDGTQPKSMTRRALMQVDLPMDWALQRRLFGYREQPGYLPSERTFPIPGQPHASSNLPKSMAIYARQDACNELDISQP